MGWETLENALSQLKGCSECPFLGASRGRPLSAVPPGHVPGDKARQEQMAPVLWLCSSLPASQCDSEKSNFSPCLSLIYISKFPEHAGCVSRWLPLSFFLSLPFSLGWWQQRWAKITLGLIIGWSCKTGFLQVFERWAALSHSLS